MTEKKEGHSFNMYILSSYYIPSTVLGTEETVMMETDKVLTLMELLD